MRFMGISRFFQRLLILVLVLPFTRSMPIAAATFSVGCDSSRTTDLITAITTANSTPELDTIELTAECVYTLTEVNNFNDQDANGLPVITTPLTLVGNGAVIERDVTTPNFRLLNVSSTGALTLTTVTLQNGRAANLFNGGAILNQGQLVVQASTFIRNYGGYGGAVANEGFASIEQSVLTQNNSNNGGAVANLINGILHLEQSLLSNNYASIGGAIINQHTLVLRNSTLRNNTGNNGGAIYNTNTGSITMVQSTLSGNAANEGAGFYAQGSITIQHSTIVSNSASFWGGGILIVGGTVTLGSSIVAGNIDTFGNPDLIGSTYISHGYNLIGNNTSISGFPAGTPNQNNDWVGSTEAPLNPQLSPLADHGGPTLTHMPLPGSLAIDHGPLMPTLAFDQRGAPRVQGVRADIGAVEAPVLAVSDTSTLEGASATFTVTLSMPLTQMVTVDYSTSDATAFDGSDYVSATGTLTFTAGMTETTVTVSTTDDLLDETDKLFRLTLSNAVNVTISDASATATIIDNDAAPSLSINDAIVVEEASAFFTATLDAPSSFTITVTYTTNNGTAEAGLDYLATSGVLTFTPGMTQTMFTVSTTDDLLDEADELFTVMLSNATHVSISDAPTTVTIIDNDAPPTLSISDTIVAEGASAIFTATLDVVSGQTVTVEYATSDGTALAGTDYVSTTGVLTFTPGMTETSILVSTTDDLLDEADETFMVMLSNPSNATLMTASAGATIIDNDAVPTMSANGLTTEEGSQLAFQVLLNEPSGLTITVNYLTNDGTATADVDYTPISGTLTFTPGMTQTTVLVSTTDDLLKEPDEDVTLLLSNPINVTLNSSQAVATILDNEDPLALSVTDISVLEGAVALFRVTLNVQSSIPVLVLYSTSDGSAEAGVDYTAITNTLTFAPGMTSTTFLVTTTADLLDEADETFTVTLSDGGSSTFETVSAQATILDDDTTFTTYLPFMTRSAAVPRVDRQR